MSLYADIDEVAMAMVECGINQRELWLYMSWAAYCELSSMVDAGQYRPSTAPDTIYFTIGTKATIVLQPQLSPGEWALTPDSPT